MFRTQNHQVQYNCLRCTLKLILKDNLSSVYLYSPSRCHLLNISVNVLLLKFKFKKKAYYMHKELRRGKALIFWIPMARNPEIRAQFQPEIHRPSHHHWQTFLVCKAGDSQCLMQTSLYASHTDEEQQVKCHLNTDPISLWVCVRF